MKTRLWTAAALVCCLALLCAAALAESCGDYEYTLNRDGGARITRYTGQDADVVIPAELDGHPVTAIGWGAFFPAVGDREPFWCYGDMFLQPGTYLSVYDANLNALTRADLHRVELPDAEEKRMDLFVPEESVRAMTRYLARKAAWEKGIIVLDDRMHGPDGQLVPADTETWRAQRVQGLRDEADGLTAQVASKEQELAQDADLSQGKRRAYERQIAAYNEQIEQLEARIADIEALVLMTDSEAVEAWAEGLGYQPTRADIAALWRKEYEPVIAAKTEADLRALGIEGFRSGIQFLIEEKGLGLPSVDVVHFKLISRDLSLDPQGAVTVRAGEDGDAFETEVRGSDYVRLEDLPNVITLPKGTDFNGYDLSLAGESNLRSVVIPACVKEIGVYAFLDCKNLERVVLSADPNNFSGQAFMIRVAKPEKGTGDIEGWYEFNPRITFVVPAGSYLEQWCVEYGHPYEYAE